MAFYLTNWSLLHGLTDFWICLQISISLCITYECIVLWSWGWEDAKRNKGTNATTFPDWLITKHTFTISWVLFLCLCRLTLANGGTFCSQNFLTFMIKCKIFPHLHRAWIAHGYCKVLLSMCEGLRVKLTFNNMISYRWA